MCSESYYRGGTPGCLTKQGGGVDWGRGDLFEGCTHSAALEGLRGAVVVHHAAGGLALSREKQAPEFAHLSEEKGERGDRVILLTSCPCHSTQYISSHTVGSLH